MERFLCFFYDKIINMINERKDHIRIQKKIYLNILQTLGRITPEAGGILGYREKIICDYYFDETAKNNINEYHPNVDILNVILSDWAEKNIEFAGLIHSHTYKNNCLSYSDIYYARRIMDGDGLRKILFPLVLVHEIPEIIFFEINIDGKIERKNCEIV